tara:strand:- start:128 stop:496 length:369 start_codon:yes stop_codon:yes gene_type:complete
MIFILSHILMAILAVFLGLRNIISKKGNYTHKVVGWIWVIAMTYVSISSFWIKSLNEGKYSLIHLLSIWVLICLVLGIYFIRKKKRKLHYAFMIGNYIGLVIAGVFTLLPGRFFDQVFNLFG